MIDLTPIYDIAQEISDIYIRRLEQGNINASGALSSGAKDWDVQYDGNLFRITLNLPEHYKYVEYGRKPGKFPPPDAIREWIRVKRIVPRAYKGKLPTQEQLVYLISRKIAKKGIPARHPLEDTIEEVRGGNTFNKLTQSIADIIMIDITNDLKNINNR